MSIQELVGESSKRTLALDLPEVKALWVEEGEIPPAGFTPCQSRPGF